MPALKLFAHLRSKPGHEKELRALVQELLSAMTSPKPQKGDISNEVRQEKVICINHCISIDILNNNGA